MFLLGPEVLKERDPIGTKSSYPVQKFLLGVFLLGPKVPKGRVPIGLTDEFIGLKNSSQSAQVWFLLGAFLLGASPVFKKFFTDAVLQFTRCLNNFTITFELLRNLENFTK